MKPARLSRRGRRAERRRARHLTRDSPSSRPHRVSAAKRLAEQVGAGAVHEDVDHVQVALLDEGDGVPQEPVVAVHGQVLVLDVGVVVHPPPQVAGAAVDADAVPAAVPLPEARDRLQGGIRRVVHGHPVPARANATHVAVRLEGPGQQGAEHGRQLLRALGPQDGADVLAEHARLQPERVVGPVVERDVAELAADPSDGARRHGARGGEEEAVPLLLPLEALPLVRGVQARAPVVGVAHAVLRLARERRTAPDAERRGDEAVLGHELVAFLAVEVEDQVHAPLACPGIEPLPGELLGRSVPAREGQVEPVDLGLVAWLIATTDCMHSGDLPRPDCSSSRPSSRGSILQHRPSAQASWIAARVEGEAAAERGRPSFPKRVGCGAWTEFTIAPTRAALRRHGRGAALEGPRRVAPVPVARSRTTPLRPPAGPGAQGVRRRVARALPDSVGAARPLAKRAPAATRPEAARSGPRRRHRGVPARPAAAAAPPLRPPRRSRLQHRPPAAVGAVRRLRPRPRAPGAAGRCAGAATRRRPRRAGGGHRARRRRLPAPAHGRSRRTAGQAGARRRRRGDGEFQHRRPPAPRCGRAGEADGRAQRHHRSCDAGRAGVRLPPRRPARAHRGPADRAQGHRRPHRRHRRAAPRRPAHPPRDRRRRTSCVRPSRSAPRPRAWPTTSTSSAVWSTQRCSR